MVDLLGAISGYAGQRYKGAIKWMENTQLTAYATAVCHGQTRLD